MSRDDPAAFAPPAAFGPFRVLHQIGIGALGPVFRTYEPTRDRLVAVKVFRLDITPEQSQALADELTRAADAGLFHPSIVEPLAAGVEGTVAYRAEEYVAAESLDVAIRHYAPAALDKALPFLTQLAGAIDFARTAGVGHGALHLRDVFVTPDEARASGFGVVEALERVGLRAPVRRPYSAPERIAGEDWGTTADVFSLGAIAYELLTGRRPSGTGDQIGAVTGVDVGAHAESIRAVLARAMHEVPSSRYPTALTFASALEAASRGRHAAVPVSTGAAPAAATSAAPTALAAPTVLATPPLQARPEDPDGPEADEEPADILAEREDDAAHHDLLRDEADDDDTPTLFDDEARHDLELDAPGPPRRYDVDGLDPAPAAALSSASWEDADDADRARGGAASGVLPAYRGAQPTDVAASDDDEPRNTAIRDRPRLAIVPLAAMLLFGMLLGFAVGYTAGRGPAPGPQAAATPEAASPTPAAAPRPQPSAEAGPQRSGRAWSEQVVAQPSATAPPVPGAEPGAEPARSSSPGGAVPTAGQMVVRSNPTRAGVTVNGEWRGRTPLTLSGLRFGSYTVRIVQPGFTTAREEIRLSAAAPSRALSFRLQRAAGSPASAGARGPAPPAASRGAAPARLVGSIYVDSRPRGARVVLDGRPVGVTPTRVNDVPIGSHVVRLELPDHRLWAVSTSVAAGKETPVTGSLDRIR
jgi:serine/threonine protein kinase